MHRVLSGLMLDEEGICDRSILFRRIPLLHEHQLSMLVPYASRCELG
jgi:hypothetical protein